MALLSKIMYTLRKREIPAGAGGKKEESVKKTDPVPFKLPLRTGQHFSLSPTASEALKYPSVPLEKLCKWWRWGCFSSSAYSVHRTLAKPLALQKFTTYCLGTIPL